MAWCFSVAPMRSLPPQIGLSVCVCYFMEEERNAELECFMLIRVRPQLELMFSALDVNNERGWLFQSWAMALGKQVLALPGTVAVTPTSFNHSR